MKKSKIPKDLKIFAIIQILTLILSPSFSQQFSTFTKQQKINEISTLHWKIENKKINFMIHKTTKGHIWFGPGSSMSSGGVYRIGKSNGGNDLTITGCKLIGTKYPDCNTGSQKFTVIAKESSANHLKVEIQRDLNTGDPSDLNINEGETNFVFAMTDNDTPEKHHGKGSYGRILINMNTGESKNSNAFGDGTFMWHRHGQLLLWTIVADSLILFGRFFKKINKHYEIHGWSFLIVILFNLVNAGWIRLGGDKHQRFLIEEEEVLNFNSRFFASSHRERVLAESLASGKAHKILANISIVMTLFITIGGIIMRFNITAKAFNKNLHSGPMEKRKLRTGHFLFGILLWVVVRGALATGTSYHQMTYGPALYIYFIIETIIFLALYVLLTVKTISRKFILERSVKQFTGENNYNNILGDLRSKSNFRIF